MIPFACLFIPPPRVGLILALLAALCFLLPHRTTFPEFLGSSLHKSDEKNWALGRRILDNITINSYNNNTIVSMLGQALLAPTWYPLSHPLSSPFLSLPFFRPGISVRSWHLLQEQGGEHAGGGDERTRARAWVLLCGYHKHAEQRHNRRGTTRRRKFK